MLGQAARCDQSRHSSSSAFSPRVRAIRRRRARGAQRIVTANSRRRRAQRGRGTRSHGGGHAHVACPHAGVSRSHQANRRLGADVECGHRDQRDRHRRRRSARRRAQRRQSARPSARHPHPHQRQHRHRGDGELRGIPRAGRQPPEAGRLHRHAPPRCGCGDSRQDQPERVGQFPLDTIDVRLELARRSDQESLRARPQSVRLELGDRRGDRREPRVDRRRHRDGWQHHLSLFGKWTGRPQANGGPRQPKRNHSNFRDAGHGRTDGAVGGGCSDVADRARGSGRGRPCHRVGKRQNS